MINMLLLLTGLSLSTNSPDSLPSKDILFTFYTSSELKHSLRYITAHTKLYNSGKDTAYFLTYSCDGLAYQLKCDTAIGVVMTHYVCVTSYPVIKKIPPKGEFVYDARLLLKNKQGKLRLDFDFTRVSKDFDLSAASIDAYNRTRQKETLWATEQLSLP